MSKIEEIIKRNINEHFNLGESLYSSVKRIEEFSDILYEQIIQGNKVLVFGNGGSAADAQHISGELLGRFKQKRKALPVIALTTDTSFLTAWSNDESYNRVFERQVEAIAKKGDVLWGLSTSGNSKNVIEAFKKGWEFPTVNLSFTGNNGGKLIKYSDFNINVNSKNTPRIQEAHMLMYHIICELVEKKIYNQNG